MQFLPWMQMLRRVPFWARWNVRHRRHRLESVLWDRRVVKGIVSLFKEDTELYSNSYPNENIILGLGLANNVELLDAKRECPCDLTDGPIGYVQTWAKQILELTEIF
jgi:hypothetical protein